AAAEDVHRADRRDGRRRAAHDQRAQVPRLSQVASEDARARAQAPPQEARLTPSRGHAVTGWVRWIDDAARWESKPCAGMDRSTCFGALARPHASRRKGER